MWLMGGAQAIERFETVRGGCNSVAARREDRCHHLTIRQRVIDYQNGIERMHGRRSPLVFVARDLMTSAVRYCSAWPPSSRRGPSGGPAKPADERLPGHTQQRSPANAYTARAGHPCLYLLGSVTLAT